MKQETPNLSVVVLCYMSADSLPSFVQLLINSINSIEQEYELVLVGNYLKGSKRKQKKQ